jgi:chemotaxis protein CheD
MGQIAIAEGPACLTAILGSCIGVALYDKKRQLGVLAHVILADSGGRTTSPGKFADTAIPHMLRLLQNRGAKPTDLVAKIVGGACMFGGGGPIQIGEDNAEATAKALRAASISVSGKDIGGTSGRRISLDCSTGTITSGTIGNPPKVL